jgi:hypothetical protein
MSHLPTRSITDAPDASRPFLEAIARSSPTGQPLNLHAQLANSPALLAAYMSLRTAGEQHGTLDGRIRAAVMLAAASAANGPYSQAVTRAIAARSGWTPDQIVAIENTRPAGDSRIDAILTFADEAARDRGHVTDAAWTRAVQEGWTAEELTESFLYVTIVTFTDHFVTFADTTLDPALRAMPARSG